MTLLDMSTGNRACRVCCETYPLVSEFFSSVRGKNGKWYFSGRCRKCDAAAARERWRSDPKAKARDRAYRAARREQIRAYDRMRAKRDRSKKRVIIDRWIRRNPDRHAELCRVKAHRRRARERGAVGTFSADDISRITKAQRNRCALCKKKSRRLTVDHIMPLARGGTNWPHNLQMACLQCNRKKNAKDPIAFMRERGALL